MVDEIDDTDEYVSPLLLYCWENDYLNARKKFLFYGKETNGWEGFKRPVNEKIINEIVDGYKKFELAKKYNTTFWRFIWNINDTFNENRTSFMWNNVLKFGKNSIGRPSKKVQDAEKRYCNFMKDEIKILNPDVIIFLTGPYYDKDIEARVGHISIEKCSEFNSRKLGVIKNDVFNCLTLRTYHPSYLNRNSEMCNNILNTIKNLIGK